MGRPEAWILLCLGLLLTLGAGAYPQEVMADVDDVEKRVFEATNAFRAAEDRPELTHDATLAKAAQRFADYMARADLYGHGADGKSPGQRLTALNYRYCMVAENIAYAFHSRGFRTSDLVGQFVEGWKKSEGHRRNMLDAEATHLGVAVAHSEKSGFYYAVQMYARPMRRSRCR